MTQVRQKMVPTKIKCPICKVVDRFEVRREALRLRSRGMKLKEAHHDLPEHRQLQMADHKCLGCRKKEGYEVPQG